jgi:hypothetical protein
MKRRYPKPFIEELEKVILTEIVRTVNYRNSANASDREKGRESTEVLLTLSQVWNLLTQRGVE